MNKQYIHKVRVFNRYYTGVLGLLDKYLLDSPYTLPEVRVMYEIYHHKKITSKEIASLLKMDKSYLSRMLSGFEKKGLIQKKSLKEDSRSQEISLTTKGIKDFLVVNQATEAQITELLSGLSQHELQELIRHMNEIQKIFSNTTIKE